MTIVASRLLRDRQICFVGIGIPSRAANLARQLQAPEIVLIYESGAVDAKPTVLPLSIGDGELARTARTVLPMSELFGGLLQGGRIEVGFLGAAQVDRFANLNSTILGEYTHPKVRLPGSGGAPDIAAFARETVILIEHSRRKLVDQVDYVTSVGYLTGGTAREQAGLSGGPSAVVTDLAILQPTPGSKELFVTSVHPGVTRQQIVDSTGWPIQFTKDLAVTPAATELELQTLRTLVTRTDEQHRIAAQKLDLLAIGGRVGSTSRK